ncbi:MAG: thioredoxin-disulfide reductase [Candidatus Improbicoccus pseudotrichonymphae]|uniref:Thioredoxin-disulfide reductase n=1 Tax=Candidatus Improbicoccus pseudotrichonymphae TaxID=3033792 RepID=A0AA48KWW0_9FIRM|nr:MAG: thioredoxin-disulfide reductase [Candidatus Improbicoccus pseudotrichonymphae]
MKNEVFDTIIIGAGPAGMAAALYAVRSGCRILIFEREVCGGKMNTTNEICNYPGILSISGPDLSLSMLNSITDLGVDIEYEEIKDTSLLGKTKYVYTESKKYSCKTVIVANGLKNRSLGCKGESEFRGRGVSYCAVCDGFFFKDKVVCIVGGGNTAIEDAIYLSKICLKVVIFVRKSNFKAENFLVDKVKNIPNIFIYFETQITEILGREFVEEVVVQSGDVERKIFVDAVFVAIGFYPDNDAFKEISKNKYGYFKSKSNCATNIPGVYVAGDCREKKLRQIVTAVSDGACAADESLGYLYKHAETKIMKVIGKV